MSTAWTKTPESSGASWPSHIIWSGLMTEHRCSLQQQRGTERDNSEDNTATMTKSMPSLQIQNRCIMRLWTVSTLAQRGWCFLALRSLYPYIWSNLRTVQLRNAAQITTHNTPQVTAFPIKLAFPERTLKVERQMYLSSQRVFTWPSHPHFAGFYLYKCLSRITARFKKCSCNSSILFFNLATFTLTVREAYWNIFRYMVYIPFGRWHISKNSEKMEHFSVRNRKIQWFKSSLGNSGAHPRNSPSDYLLLILHLCFCKQYTVRYSNLEVMGMGTES